jgi:hypothetical protein
MINPVLQRLAEREKELICIYQVEEILKDTESGLNAIFRRLLKTIPPAWQHPSVCEVKITYEDQVFQTDDWRETEWMQSADIIIDNNIVGKIEICYTLLIRLLNDSQFLPEEQKLLNTIADRVGEFIFYKKLKPTLELIKKAGAKEVPETEMKSVLSAVPDEYWRWRLKMAQAISEKLDMERLGVEAVYVIGSTKDATSGPVSDIDLLLHFRGNEAQRKQLEAWMEGWSLCLDEFNYSKTGYRTLHGLIDLHLITDDDIANKTSYAVMIGSSYNSARLLRKKETN